MNFRENKASHDGGAMFNSGNSSPVISNSMFVSNTAGHDGGAMYNSDGSTPRFSSVKFSGNSATNRGGAMFNNATSPEIYDVYFGGNAAQSGGAMANLYAYPKLTSVTFASNFASYVGGAIYNNAWSSPTLNTVDFTGNVANVDGGGMYNSNSSSPTLNQVNFRENKASRDGGAMLNSDSSSAVVSNSVFVSNTAGHDGGAVYNRASTPRFSAVTFTGNSATNRGGVMYNNAASPEIYDACFGTFVVFANGNLYRVAVPGSGTDTWTHLISGVTDMVGLPGGKVALLMTTGALQTYDGQMSTTQESWGVASIAVNAAGELVPTYTPIRLKWQELRAQGMNLEPAGYERDVPGVLGARYLPLHTGEVIYWSQQSGAYFLGLADIRNDLVAITASLRYDTIPQILSKLTWYESVLTGEVGWQVTALRSRLAATYADAQGKVDDVNGTIWQTKFAARTQVQNKEIEKASAISPLLTARTNAYQKAKLDQREAWRTFDKELRRQVDLITAAEAKAVADEAQAVKNRDAIASGNVTGFGLLGVDEVVEDAKDVGGQISAAGQNIGGQISAFVKDPAGTLEDWKSKAAAWFTKAKKDILDTRNKAVGAANTAIETAKRTYSDAVKAIQDVRAEAVRVLNDKIETASQPFNQAITAIQDARDVAVRQLEAKRDLVVSVAEEKVKGALDYGVAVLTAVADSLQDGGTDFAKGAKLLGGLIAEELKNAFGTLFEVAFPAARIQRAIWEFAKATPGLIRAPLAVATSLADSLSALGGARWDNLIAPIGSGAAAPTSNPFQGVKLPDLKDATSLLSVNTALSLGNFNIKAGYEASSGRWSAELKVNEYRFGFSWRSADDLSVTFGYGFGNMAEIQGTWQPDAAPRLTANFNLSEHVSLTAVTNLDSLDKIEMTTKFTAAGWSVAAKGMLEATTGTYRLKTVTLEAKAGNWTGRVTAHHQPEKGDYRNADAWYYTIAVGGGTNDVKLEVQGDPQTGKVTGVTINVDLPDPSGTKNSDPVAPNTPLPGDKPWEPMTPPGPLDGMLKDGLNTPLPGDDPLKPMTPPGPLDGMLKDGLAPPADGSTTGDKSAEEDGNESAERTPPNGDESVFPPLRDLHETEYTPESIEFAKADSAATAKPGLDIDKMVDIAIADARTGSGGTCSRYVADAINRAFTDPEHKELPLNHGSGKAAKDGWGPASGGAMGPKLADVGFDPVEAINGQISLQKGDVVVIRTMDSVSGSPANGHVAIWTGSQWVSDYLQQGGTDPNVYANSQKVAVVSYEVYRYAGVPHAE